MARPPPDPDLVRETLGLLRAGVGQAEAARVAGVDVGTVRRWRARFEAALFPEAPAAPPAPPAEASPPPAALAEAAPIDPDAPAIEIVRGAILEARRTQAADLSVGDKRAAQHAARTLATLLPILSRLEKAEKADAGRIVISRAELDTARAAYRERVGRLLSAGPLTCAACGRALRVAWAEEPGPEGEALPPKA